MLKAETNTNTVYYTRGFELISRREGATASYYIYDGGLSVRALTNEAGIVTDTLVFDAFGNATTKTGPSDNSYGFQGEEQDATGLYYLRARYMNPATGTFTTMDTYGGSLSDPMSLHKYLFANSNPVMYSDPSGHYTMTEQMLVCGLIGELASSTLYLVELFTTDNIQYDSWQSSLLGSLNVVVTGFAAGVFFCALHIVFAALVGTAIAAIVFGAFGVAMSILGMIDGTLDWQKGNDDLGTVKVLISIIGLVFSVNSVSSGVQTLPSGYTYGNGSNYNETNTVGTGKSANSESGYIPKDEQGNPIPLAKQRINNQDIPLPDPRAEGRPHTVIGGKVSSETGEVYRQTATFDGNAWPRANGYDVPRSEVHWTDHGRPWDHTNPHQHVFMYDETKGGWYRSTPMPF